jgi:hypothetical protein
MKIVTDNIGLVVAAMRDAVIPNPKAKGAGSPYYMYGHRREIDNRLLEKYEDKVFKYQRYPLIALACPIPEVINGGVLEYTLNLAILCSTDKGYNAEERMENVFKPILYPLYEEFFDALRDSGLFMWPGNQERPQHTKVDRFYYGTQFSEGTEVSIFTDPLDAVEIIDLKISSYINC